MSSNKASQYRSNWGYYLSLLLNVLLSGICFFLILQNKDLKGQFGVSPERFARGKQIEPFDLLTLDGREIRLALNENTGRHHLIYIFDAKCHYCAEGIPYIGPLYDALPSEQCDLIGISLENIELTKIFVKENMVTFPIYINADEEFPRRYRIGVPPVIFLLDENGFLVDTWSGVIDGLVVSRIISTLEASSSGASRE